MATSTGIFDPSLFRGYSAIGSSSGGGVTHGAFGSIPGAIPVPASTGQQVNANIPGFQNLTNSTTSAIQNQINGKLSPSTIAQLRDAAATYGVSMGVPGSQFQNYDYLRSLGLNAEEQTNRGIQNHNATLATVAPTQASPELTASIADRNTNLAAAPDPAAAASYAMDLFNKYLDAMKPAAPVSSGTTPYVWQPPPGSWQSSPGTWHTLAPAGQ